MWWDKPRAKPRTVGETKPWPFMRIRWLGFVISALVVIGTTASLAIQGLNMGLDFTGGVLIEASRTQPFDDNTVRADLLDAGLAHETGVALADEGRTALIRLPPLAAAQDPEVLMRKITTALGEGVTIGKTDAIGPKVSGDLFQGSVIASLLAITAIAIYIWFRSESRFGLSAFITIFHDVYALVGLFSITRMTFDLTAVAGILTIAGYSINDKVVVFDRIREMLKKHKRLAFPQTIDISITATLSRTVVTATGTLCAAVPLLFLGGPVLFGLAAAICFGIVVGTYSSIFVAAPLLIHLPGAVPGARILKDAEKAAASAR